MSEPTLTPQDQQDLASLGITLEGEQPTERCLLELWQAVLANRIPAAAKPIEIGVATAVVRSWPFLTFQETARYHVLYHEVLNQIAERLDEVIAENPEATSWVGEEDAAHNHLLYRQLLVEWHQILDTLESAWRAEDEESHIWVAVIPDVRSFIFSRVGLAGHLDAIGFALTNDEFLVALQEAKGE
jgi:hypothetical protein